MINLSKPCEGLDYVIQPVPEIDNEQAWCVEIKTGQFKGIMMILHHIEYNGKMQKLAFQVDAIDSNSEPVMVDDGLSDYTFEILQDIIRTALSNGSVTLDDKDSDN